MGALQIRREDLKRSGRNLRGNEGRKKTRNIFRRVLESKLKRETFGIATNTSNMTKLTAKTFKFKDVLMANNTVSGYKTQTAAITTLLTPKEKTRGSLTALEVFLPYHY